MQSIIDIPEPVRLKALAAGAVGEAWLAELVGTVRHLAAAWGLSIGRTLTGGTEALVTEATTSDGRAAVLKILPPWLAASPGEFQTLQSARGQGYAEVYALDEAAGAIVLERLGPPLATLGLPVDEQIAIICATLVEAWATPPEGVSSMDGAEKAHSLSEFIDATWRELGRPCPAAVIDTALDYAEARRRSFDPRSAVLAHGDAHAWNTLLVPNSRPERFKLIDPDGLFIERAYDLAIPMREWTDELLAGDPLSLGRRRCRRLAQLAGIEPEPIWQWGYIERVSTGLLCLKVGLHEGHAMLAVAERWSELL
jgi:streptomycin 6-kinase